MEEMDKRLERITSEIKNKLPSNAIEFESKWQNSVIDMETGKEHICLVMEYEYYLVKKDGTKGKNRRKGKEYLIMEYNPFSGEKL